MSIYEILKFFSELKDVHGQLVFKPSDDFITFDAINGKERLSKSYYRTELTSNGTVEEWFEFRAADHGSSMSRREKQIRHKPWRSKRNIDIVFTDNGISSCDLKATRFFIIEQYVYRCSDITQNKLNKIVNALLNIGVKDFKDPLGIANYSILRPVYYTDENTYIEIPKDNSVNYNQIKILNDYILKKNESLNYIYNKVESFDEYTKHNKIIESFIKTFKDFL